MSETSDARSQEAEDVARAVREIIAPLRSPLTKDEIAAALLPGVARLVREGQIRVLEGIAADRCRWCAWKLNVKPTSRRARTFVHLDAKRKPCAACRAPEEVARIAALRQEG